MDKIEEHFEGRRPENRMRLALFIVGFAVFASFIALFVKMSLPTQRTELVGKWKGPKPGLGFDFRGDGTFSGVVIEDWVGGNPTLRISLEGQWKASHNSVYLTFSRYDAVTKPKDRLGFVNFQKEMLTRPAKRDLVWHTGDQWAIEGYSGIYVREGSLKTAPTSP
jgi:hypothetical protein